MRHDTPMSERKRNTKSAKQNTKGANILLGLRPRLSICFVPFVFCFALFVLNQISSSTQSTSLPNTPGAFSLSWRICAVLFMRQSYERLTALGFSGTVSNPFPLVKVTDNQAPVGNHFYKRNALQNRR